MSWPQCQPADARRMSEFRFELLATDGAARCGRLHTAHGAVDTPAFMPVGTAATVKAMTPTCCARPAPQIVLANTYHLMLRPGAERVARLGGLHRFMAWPGPILTDSGGFQVMSLAARRKIDEDGVVFSSHLDGSRASRSRPERCDGDPAPARLRHHDGAGRVPALSVGPDEAAASMRLHDALGGALPRRLRRRAAGYGLFGIVQGGVDPDLRRESAGRLVEIGFDGYAIGGLAVGETRPMMDAIVARTCRRAAGRPAALSDGRRQAGRSGRRHRARRRHVRLRAADPLGPHTARPGPARARSTCATPASPRTRRRSIRTAAARPARELFARLSAPPGAPTRSSAPCC